MQPNRDPAQWQQPNEQPSQAPFEATSTEASTPVVTMAPDQAAEGTPWIPPEPTRPGPVDPATEQQVPVDDTLVRWKATEYIHREKNPIWYVLFVLIAVGLTTFAIFVMKEITFAILVPVMSVALFMYTRRPPRILEYTLSRQGLHVNDHLYSFAEFKSFGVVHDEEEYSVVLVPVKRFKPALTVYFPEESGEAIVDMLGARLPMRELHLDLADRVIRKLRI